jgi:membrane protease YdiL (CAAX protease family)
MAETCCEPADEIATADAPQLAGGEKVLIALILLPLAAIGVQLALGFHGAANSLYKMCFLIPPILYCRSQGIELIRDILKPRNWRRSLGVAGGLGLAAIVIFWTAYALFGDRLLDKEMIGQSIGRQFVVNAKTVLFVAPVTIFLNSLIEEFFYRGFAFGLLVRRKRLLGYVLPAAVFITQHVLFFWYWLAWVPFCVATVGLLVFALVLEWLYERADSIVAPWLVHICGDVAMMGIAVTLLLLPR